MYLEAVGLQQTENNNRRREAEAHSRGDVKCLKQCLSHFIRNNSRQLASVACHNGWVLVWMTAKITSLELVATGLGLTIGDAEQHDLQQCHGS